jgi:hypothetical protein
MALGGEFSEGGFAKPVPETVGPGPIYWAAGPAQELISELDRHERVWWSAGARRGYWQLLRLCYAQAYGMDPATGAANTTQQLQFSGPGASIVRFRVNLTRGHIKQRNILAQGERPAFQCLAINDDFQTLSQIPMAQSVVDYLFRAAKGEQAGWKALESDGYFGEGALWGRWDADGGDDVTVMKPQAALDEAGQPLQWPDGETVMKPQPQTVKSGMPTLTALYPWQIVREPNTEASPWVMVREKRNKWELAALYPEQREAILSASNLMSELGIAEMFGYDLAGASDDIVIVRHFYHRDSGALPGGRYVGVVNGTALWDLPNPLPSGNPVKFVCTGRYFGTSFGYPEAADLLSMQEMIDELLTQGANNLMRFGNQSLWAEDGVEVDMRKLAEGGGFFTHKPGQQPPRTVEWAKMPDAGKWMLEFLIERMNDISGMNSVARGAPDANIQSGTFAALMLNIAQKFVSATEASNDDMRNEAANMLLDLVRANSEAPFLAEVAGANQAPYIKQFTKQDLSGVRRVQVATSSPLMRTIPGRLEVFQALQGLSKEQRQAAYQLITTGNADAFVDLDQSCSLLIQYENEQLMKGQWCEPAATDDPILHCEKHKSMLDRLRAMEQPDVKGLQMLQEHISKHGLLWAGVDPVLAAMIGLPHPPVIPNSPMAGNKPVGPEPQPKGAPNAGGAPANDNGGGGSPAAPGSDMPTMPKPPAPPPNAMRQPAPPMAPAT